MGINAFRYVHKLGLCEREWRERLRTVRIHTFAPQALLAHWWQFTDPRFLGVTGSTEDLDVILQERVWERHPFRYIPFSGNWQEAVDELGQWRATWEDFHMTFSGHNRTFKFNPRPTWLPSR